MNEKLFDCPICYEKSALVMKAPCGHAICANCCKRTFLEVNQKCPFCRTKLPQSLKKYTISTCLNFENENLNKNQIQNIFPFVCAEGNLQNVIQIVEIFEIDINENDSIFGINPLCICAQNGFLNLVKYLVKKGANLNATEENFSKMTPLFMAASHGHLNITQFLISQGANVNQGKTNGTSPLMMACQQGYVEIAKILILNGANVNQIGKNGIHPLWISARNGHLEIVNLLLEHGANIDMPNAKNETPLLKSAQNGHFLISKILIENGARLLRARHKKSALYQNGNFFIVKFFRDMRLR